MKILLKEYMNVFQLFPSLPKLLIMLANNYVAPTMHKFDIDLNGCFPP